MIDSIALFVAMIPVIATCAKSGDASGQMESSNSKSADSTMGIQQSEFGVTASGDSVDLYSLTNGAGMTMRVTNYGGTIVSLRVPGRDGSEDVVLGFNSLDPYTSEEYVATNTYLGALIGRYANRIDEAQFTLDGQTYTLEANNGPNHLHGGEEGFDKVLWQAEPFKEEAAVGLVLSHVSPAGHGGYPGRLDVEVTYRVTDDNELAVDYRATTTKATPVNLTQHSYFNLKGEGEGTVLGHKLRINAEAFTPVDSTLIPTGEARPVTGTPFDFRKSVPIGQRIDVENQQLKIAEGYDHNFVLSRQDRDSLHLAAQVYEPKSGRELQVLTTEPGLQFYSGNFLDGSLIGKSGASYQKHAGFALETQHFPNSPNEPDFPSTILRPGEIYTSRTVYQFSFRGRSE